LVFLYTLASHPLNSADRTIKVCGRPGALGTALAVLGAAGRACKGRWKDRALPFGVYGRAEAGRLACFTEMKIHPHFHRCYKHTEASRSFLSRKKCIKQS